MRLLNVRLDAVLAVALLLSSGCAIDFDSEDIESKSTGSPLPSVEIEECPEEELALYDERTYETTCRRGAVSTPIEDSLALLAAELIGDEFEEMAGSRDCVARGEAGPEDDSCRALFWVPTERTIFSMLVLSFPGATVDLEGRIEASILLERFPCADYPEFEQCERNDDTGSGSKDSDD